MNLSELLSELREGILNDRTDRVSGTPDYLWTDTTLVRYINEAQKRLAIRGLVLRDATTSAVTDITLVQGQTEYDLHDSVIAVVSGKISDRDADLARVGHSILSGYYPAEDRLYDTEYWTALPPGAPLGYSTDEGVKADDAGSLSQMTLRVYPEPDATAAGTVIKLRVVRKPLVELTAVDSVDYATTIPEVPEEHHLDMLSWAAYLALRIVDDDAGNPKRAEDFRQMFEAHVKEAKQTAMRKLFAPIPWGYGRNGWSWEH